MTLDEALFLIDRSGTNSKCRGDELKTNIKNGDKVLVQRVKDHFYCEYNGDWDNLQDSDLLLVWEDNQSKYVTGQTFKTLFDDVELSYYRHTNNSPTQPDHFQPQDSGNRWNAWPGNSKKVVLTYYKDKLVKDYVGNYPGSSLEVDDADGNMWLRWEDLSIDASGNNGKLIWGIKVKAKGSQWNNDKDYTIKITGVPGLS